MKNITKKAKKLSKDKVLKLYIKTKIRKDVNDMDEYAQYIQEYSMVDYPDFPDFKSN